MSLQLIKLLDAITITGPQGPPGADGGISTSAQIVSLLRGTTPRFDFGVYGDSSDGGATPDTATQTAINNLIAIGIPLEAIVWRYVIMGGVFTMPSQSYTPTITTTSLVGIATGGTGLFTVPSQSLVPTVTAPSLIGFMDGVFTIPTQSLTPTVTAPTLATSAAGDGVFTMPAQSCLPTITTPTLYGVMTGAFTMPTQSRTPTITVTTLTGVSGGASSFSDTFTGTNGDPLNSANWASSAATIQSNKASLPTNTTVISASAIPFNSASSYVEVDFGMSMVSQAGDYDEVVCIQNSSDVGSTHNRIYAELHCYSYDDGSGGTIADGTLGIICYNAAGATSSLASFGSGLSMVNSKFKILFINSSHVRIYKDGVELAGSPFAVTCTIGSTYKAVLSTGGYEDFQITTASNAQTFDNFVCT